MGESPSWILVLKGLVSLSVPVINAVLSKSWRRLIRHVDYLQLVLDELGK